LKDWRRRRGVNEIKPIEPDRRLSHRVVDTSRTILRRAKRIFVGPLLRADKFWNRAILRYGPDDFRKLPISEEVYEKPFASVVS
jgi:hypothetical protein